MKGGTNWSTMLRSMPFASIKNMLLHAQRPQSVRQHDDSLIRTIKSRYTHSDREFHHGNSAYVADCIYCHAAPGTLETSLLVLKEMLSTAQVSKRLLNLGGGTGQVSSILAEIGFDVTTLDIEIQDSSMPAIRFDLNSDRDLPFDQEYFDFVLCQEVIEHIENPWKLLRNIRRILKETGSFVLTTPNILSAHSRDIFRKSGYFHWFTPDCFSYHINPLPFWEIELIAERCDLRIKELKGNGEYFFGTAQGRSKLDLLHNNECLIFVMERKS